MFNKTSITCPNIGPSGGPAAANPAGIFVFMVGPCLTFSTTFFILFSLLAVFDILKFVLSKVGTLNLQN